MMGLDQLEGNAKMGEFGKTMRTPRIVLDWMRTQLIVMPFFLTPLIVSGCYAWGRMDVRSVVLEDKL